MVITNIKFNWIIISFLAFVYLLFAFPTVAYNHQSPPRVQGPVDSRHCTGEPQQNTKGISDLHFVLLRLQKRAYLVAFCVFYQAVVAGRPDLLRVVYLELQLPLLVDLRVPRPVQPALATHYLTLEECFS